MKKGKVYRLKEGFVPDGNFQLNEGIAERDGWLWIAEKPDQKEPRICVCRSVTTGTRLSLLVARFEEEVE